MKCYAERAKKATGIYAPNQETPKVDFFNEVVPCLESGWGTRIQILLGDFNAVESAADRNALSTEDQRVREVLKGARDAKGNFRNSPELIEDFHARYPEMPGPPLRLRD